MRDNDGAFDRVNEWLSRMPLARESRRGQLATSYAREDSRAYVGLGLGKHFGRIGGHWVLVEREMHTSQGVRPVESIKFRSLGSPGALRSLVEKGAAAPMPTKRSPCFCTAGTGDVPQRNGSEASKAFT